MLSTRVNLIAILLAVYCAVRATEHPRSTDVERREEEGSGMITGGDRAALGYTYGNATSGIIEMYDRIATADKLAEMDIEGVRNAHSKADVEERDEARRKKKAKFSHAIVAMLMAYKLKLVALIPTLIGGFILLKGTTLLAGFFFALFAAVLGLKTH